MAIEPLSSAMTFTAQPISQTQTARATVQPAAEYAEVPEQQSAVPVDNVTLTVNAAEQKDTNADEGGKYEQPEPSVSAERIKKAVEDLNKKMANSEAQFGIHEATNRVTIKIVDKESKKVIKELPPEKTLDMIAKVWEMAGLLVDEKR